MRCSSGLGNYFNDSDTASIGGRRPGLDPGPARRNSGQGTRWHQAARVGPERQPHCRPHRAPQRRAHDRSHASTARCLQDGLGLSSGITVVDVEGAPASLGLRDRPQAAIVPSKSERPTAAGALADRSSPSAACPGEDGTSLAPEPTRRSVHPAPQPVSPGGELPSCQLRLAVLPPDRQAPWSSGSPASTYSLPKEVKT
jgi:hypothetical protein